MLTLGRVFLNCDGKSTTYHLTLAKSLGFLLLVTGLVALHSCSWTGKDTLVNQAVDLPWTMRGTYHPRRCLEHTRCLMQEWKILL